MEMLEYCKTYNIMKSSLTNPGTTDIHSQNESLASIRHQSEHSYSRNGEVVTVEPVHHGELALYRTVARLQEENTDSEETKLNPLKEIKRSKTMISTVKHQQRVSFESELTFAPKLNALSIKLAKDRGEKLRTALTRRATALQAETESNFTFKPKVSSKSVKIVQNMKTSFLDRQQMHVEKQRKHTENIMVAYASSKPRLTPVNLSKSPSRIKKPSKSTDTEEIQNDIEDKPSTQSLPSSISTSDLDHREVQEIEVSTTEETDYNDSLHSPSDTSMNECSPRNSTSKLEQISEGARRLQESSPYNQSTENLYMKKKQRNIRVAHKRGVTHPLTSKSISENDGWNNSTKVDTNTTPNGTGGSNKIAKANHSRTISQPSRGGRMKYDDPLFEKVRHAKEVAESALKSKKVFICHGAYPIVRATLRRRGWVEKHFKGSLISKKDGKSNDSDDDSCDSGDDSDNDQPSSHVSPRGNTKSINKDTKNKQALKKIGVKGIEIKKEKNVSDDSESDDDDDGDDDNEDWNAGYEDGPNCEFNLMSRMVRNAVPTMIWTVKSSDIDFKFLRKDQMANHYSGSYSFTTKVGLCANLRNLQWYENMDPNMFFPRCHRLGAEEDKLDFIDDYRLTSAAAILRWVVNRCENGPQSGPSRVENEKQDHPVDGTDVDRSSTQSAKNVLPVRALALSLEACREFLQCKEHLDIDDTTSMSSSITDAMWDQIVDSFCQLRNGAVIANAHPFLRECQNTLNLMREYLPQIDIDGLKNIWIVKPGAKSRGRGIMVMDQLEDILKLTGNINGQKEGRWVAQKYIERPLLIYGVKFDIRQWFLVTDWNPLTLWFYEDCYLRFCSQNFSLENFHVAIHLANNSIQKNFDNNETRDKRLPDENMWSSDEFKAYLNKRDVGHMWNSVIYPGMKQAVIHALQSCQEIVEYRKNSFELYGADFIIGENYTPWLIEINSSPTMGASTAVTRKLCAQVLEDTMKVILDRKEDKNCSTGSFELAYKQAHISAPPYIGMNMSVEGQCIGHKPAMRRHSSAKLTTLTRPQETKKVLQPSQEADLRRGNPKPTSTSTRTTFVKKSEGAWAMGCIATSQKPAPVPPPNESPRSKQDDKGIKKLSRSKTGIHVTTAPNQRVSSRAMTIPKAVLRYSGDAGIQQRTQLPISIGPDTRGKAF